MHSADGNLTLIFNGEIYNHIALRQRFLPGYSFRTTSDTETLLALFQMRPSALRASLAELDGMFALALWNASERRLTLVRDRLGIKPLYYVLRSGSIAFASEAGALARAGCSSGALSVEGMSSYLTWGSVVGTQSIYEDIRELEPGHLLVYENGRSELAPWWEPQFSPTGLSDAQASELLTDTIADSVKSQLVSDRQLGVFLSSGVDSTAVASMAARAADIKAVTLTFPEDPALNEEVAARGAARRLGLDHACIPVLTADIGELLSQFFADSDQPTFDGFNSYLVSRATARAGVTVALSGLGGDELFGGYGMEAFAERNRRRSRWLRPLGAGLRERLGAHASQRRPGSGTARLMPAHGDEAVYLATRGIFDHAYVRQLLPGAQLALPSWPGSRDFRDNVTILEWRTYLASQLLRDVDTASMRYSLEVRVPLLSNALLDLTLSLPPEQRFRIGKRSLATLAGQAETTTKKGFNLPYDRWLRTSFAPVLREGLLSQELALADVLDLGSRRRLYDAFSAGRVHWMRPWLVASLRLWAQANTAAQLSASGPATSSGSSEPWTTRVDRT